MFGVNLDVDTLCHALVELCILRLLCLDAHLVDIMSWRSHGIASFLVSCVSES